MQSHAMVGVAPVLLVRSDEVTGNTLPVELCQSLRIWRRKLISRMASVAATISAS